MRRLATTAIGFLALAGLSACGGGGGGSTESFCDVANDINELNASFDGSEQPNFDLARTVADRLVGAAPAEIREDAEVLRDAITAFAEAFEGVEDFSDPAALERFNNLDIDEERVQTATDNINAFAEEECGITIEG